MSIKTNLKEIIKKLSEDVTLVAVSKTKSNEEIMEAYEVGQRIFGENKVQEMAKKWEDLPKDIEWHMIGHVQSNKVKYMAPFVSLIHGVDSLKLLKEINKQAAKNERVIECLLQVHIAKEDTKFGFSEEEITTLWNDHVLSELTNVQIIGLMGMATFTEDDVIVQREFESLYKLFKALQKNNNAIKTLSMGMSNDYKIGIKEGSTMVRIGSSIFGKRNY
ncbi:MAG: YggS family pyridoxal phosphate-dependent enzyme [Eudoraea sp.]|uniref:YggS family pyridoxal phosphate-dependent enzyme n=1 Tax=Eudoraea sp. TaxID=1979955 RepID=UPI003C7968DD